jgi:hypothetical protein
MFLNDAVTARTCTPALCGRHHGIANGASRNLARVRGSMNEG